MMHAPALHLLHGSALRMTRGRHRGRPVAVDRLACCQLECCVGALQAAWWCAAGSVVVVPAGSVVVVVRDESTCYQLRAVLGSPPLPSAAGQGDGFARKFLRRQYKQFLHAKLGAGAGGSSPSPPFGGKTRTVWKHRLPVSALYTFGHA